jgi:hypothetical protein
MPDPFTALTTVLSDVILPNLKAVQINQAEQIAANDSLEHSLEELRTHLDTHFALLNAQMTACRAELAVTQAALKAAQIQSGLHMPKTKLLIH